MRIIERTWRWLALPTMCLLGGCGNLSGIGGTAEYGCKAPSGVRCQSVSATYAEAAKAGVPAAPMAPMPAPRPGHAVMSPLPAVAPLRLPPRFLRLWIKRWEDRDRDLVDQSHLYVRIDDGRWDLPHVPAAVPGAVAGAPTSAARDAAGTSVLPPPDSPTVAGAARAPQKNRQSVERSGP